MVLDIRLCCIGGVRSILLLKDFTLSLYCFDGHFNPTAHRSIDDSIPCDEP